MQPPQKDMRLLEVGCGTGSNLKLYQQDGCRVSGIDLSPAMAEQAHAKLGPSADIRLGDASQMPFDTDAFDVALAMLTLHEMPGHIRETVLHEMKRVARPGGRLVLIDFHPGPLQPVKGWYYKAVIHFFEMIAGREHFRNYRHFIHHKGLKPLITGTGLSIEKEKILGGGNMAIYLTDVP